MTSALLLEDLCILPVHAARPRMRLEKFHREIDLNPKPKILWFGSSTEFRFPTNKPITKRKFNLCKLYHLLHMCQLHYITISPTQLTNMMISYTLQLSFKNGGNNWSRMMYLYDIGHTVRSLATFKPVFKYLSLTRLILGHIYVGKYLQFLCAT